MAEIKTKVKWKINTIRNCDFLRADRAGSRWDSGWRNKGISSLSITFCVLQIENKAHQRITIVTSGWWAQGREVVKLFSVFSV